MKGLSGTEDGDVVEAVTVVVTGDGDIATLAKTEVTAPGDLPYPGGRMVDNDIIPTIA